MRDESGMFGYTKLFRSRWRALIWAAGILWFAYDTWAPDEPAHSPATESNLQNALE